MRLGFFVLFSFLAPLLTAAQSTTDAEQEVRRLCEEEIKAFRAGDVAVLDRLWSSDFIVANPLNKFVDKQTVLGMIRSGVLANTSYERAFEYVHVYADTAVVAGIETVTWGEHTPNAGKTQRLRFTCVWIKQGRRRQQVARHANIAP